MNVLNKIKDWFYGLRYSKSKKPIILAVLIIVSIMIIILISKGNKVVTGKEWFLKQEEYVTTLSLSSTSLDNIVSLYLNGNISVEDYYNHLTTLRTEADIIIVSYKEDKEKYPVKTGTHDYYTKLGCDATENTITLYSSLIDECMKSDVYLDKDKLMYVYLAYSQDITTYMADYMLANSVINYDKLYNKEDK